MRETKENRIETIVKNIKKRAKPLTFAIKIAVIIIILFLVIELLSFCITKIYQAKLVKDAEKISLFEDKEFAKSYFKELRDSDRWEYAPYLGFKRIPNYSGKYINIDEESIRKTKQYCNLSEKKVKIFVFGGSTVWGSWATDNGTLPSQLSRYLCENNISAEITNFGEGAYVSTQDIIRLQLELKKGNVPDIVIFYGGINDLFSAYQSETAGLPQNIKDRKEDFGARKKLNVIGFLLNSDTVRIMKKVFPSPSKQATSNETLEESIVAAYLNNANITKGLEDDFGFKSFFYWQPELCTKDTRSA